VSIRVTAGPRERKGNHVLIQLRQRSSILRKSVPENLVGEGLLPRSCARELRKSHGGEG